MIYSQQQERRKAITTTKAASPLGACKTNITSLLIITCFIAALFIIRTTTMVDGFIKFGYILNTTACDTCDELRTYSGRNVFCCLAQSKCCGPNSLDELDALTTTVAP